MAIFPCAVQYIIYKIFIDLFMYSCTESPSLCGRGFSLAVVPGGLLSSFVVHGLLIVVTSLAVEYGLWGGWAAVVSVQGLSSCGSWVLEHRFHSCGAGA